MDLFKKLDTGSMDILKAVGQLADVDKLKAYLVGGPVRDLWLGLPSLDLDIVIVGNAMAVAKEFAAQEKGKLVVYPAFKTATVTLSDGRMIDFATARKEQYVRPGAFPKVVPSTIKDDLFRRDFTINAVAVSINAKTWGKVEDPFGGLKDLKGKRVRVLHEQSFVDDPTRILRAARFKERFGFKMEKTTLALIKAAFKKDVFMTIRPQRYKKEYDKILKEKKSSSMIGCLKEWGK